MLCLPEKYIYSWIFGIQIRSSMSKEIREHMREYKKECSDILYKHFKGSLTHRKELLDKINSNINKIRKSKKELGSNELYNNILILEHENKKNKRLLKLIDENITKQDETLF